ncbi:hypothetical protein TUN199_05549 [Pyrenophora tritici-repentis]|nr:hypothetical protein Alg130_05372 [Pyrenophora tritici-repentis]KAI0610448.1 hypothetical protein TUN205_05320 [Pyrenophora tritici-repentis]KAI0622444.1 hypothetical protein TUN199_05549 [Pyrenophora tritici-repentis]
MSSFFFLAAFLCLTLVVCVEASPVQYQERDVGRVERPLQRTIVVVVCILYAFILALVQGYRAGRIAGKPPTKTQFSDVLVFVQGFVCTAFVFATAMIVAGLGLHTEPQCYAAIRVCIAMYAAAKIPLYLFLLERVHIVRAPFVDRQRDPIYVVGSLLTIGGFLGIMGYQFVNPMAVISPDDGQCRIGIEPRAAIAIVVLDTVINFGLTGIFVWQIRPTLASVLPELSSAPGTPRLRTEFPARGSKPWMKRTHQFIRSSSQNDFRVMLIRNVVGSGFMLIVTLCNNGLFLNWNFAKMGHACLLMCLTDVVLGMLVTQLLTMRSAVPDASLLRRSSSTPLISNATGYDQEGSNFRRPVPGFSERSDWLMLSTEKPGPVREVIDDNSRFNLR